MKLPRGTPKTLPIESLLLVPALQMREDQDHSHVLDLAEVLTAGKKLPRVQVIHVAEGDHTGYFVFDGFHTTLAHQRAGKKRVSCLVRKGTWDEAVVAAAGANTAHLGLKRTREDKRRAVKMLLEQFGRKWTDGKIADHVDVSPTFVRGTRLGAKAEEPETEEPETKEGADGKVYTTKKRARPKVNQDADDPPETTAEAAQPESAVEVPAYRDFEGAAGQAGRMIESVVKAHPKEKQSAEYAAARRLMNDLMKTMKDWLLRLVK